MSAANKAKKENYDTLVEFWPVAGEYQGTRNDDIDFRSAGGNSRCDFGQTLLQRRLARGKACSNGSDRNTSALKGSTGFTHTSRVHADCAYSNLAILDTKPGDDVLANGEGGFEAKAVDVSFGIVSGQGCQINALHCTKKPGGLPIFLDGTEVQKSRRGGIVAQQIR